MCGCANMSRMCRMQVVYVINISEIKKIKRIIGSDKKKRRPALNLPDGRQARPRSEICESTPSVCFLCRFLFLCSFGFSHRIHFLIWGIGFFRCIWFYGGVNLRRRIGYFCRIRTAGRTIAVAGRQRKGQRQCEQWYANVSFHSVDIWYYKTNPAVLKMF